MLTQKSVKENLAKDHFASENPEEKEVNLYLYRGDYRNSYNIHQ